MKNSLKLIILEGCPYSIALDELLSNYPKITINKIIVSYKNKESFKTPEISTFPQLYMIENYKQYLIGGYDKTKDIIEEINKNSNSDKLMKILKKKLPNLTNKQILRLILNFVF